MTAATLALFSSLFVAKTFAAPDVAFGYLDSAGKRLLAMGEIAEPARLTRATCGGALVSIKYRRLQPRGRKDSGRQTRFNFDQSEGYLFEVADKMSPTDDTCLLGTAEFFAGRKVLPLETDGKTACDAQASAAVAAAVGRNLERCVTLGSFAGRGRVVAAHFARKGDEELAALVLLGAGPASVRAFPAKVDPENISCWRVDDGCQFEPSAFKVPLALVGPELTELLFLWDGAEGQSAELLRAGPTLEPVVHGSRYWSPE